MKLKEYSFAVLVQLGTIIIAHLIHNLSEELLIIINEDFDDDDDFNNDDDDDDSEYTLNEISIVR